MIVDFIASDYCFEVGLKPGIERSDAGQAIVIPIIVRFSSWALTPLAGLQSFTFECETGRRMGTSRPSLEKRS